MGSLISVEKKKSKRIDQELRKDNNNEQQITKLLLLGPADCGKSTVLKQMKILHGIGFSETEIRLQKSTICFNLVFCMNQILEAMKTFQIQFKNMELEVESAVIEEANKLIKDDNFTLSFNMTMALKKLWADSGVQKCYKRGNEYSLNDSAKYFFDDIERLSDPNYTPTEQDILRSRIATTGVVEIKFTAGPMTIKMFDVGGQRSERRKWIHCFDNVDAVFYLASLSEYNTVLMEDGVTNRMHESLKLFERLCQSSYFAKASMLLFLNKTDVFEEKIKTHPLTVAFSEYHGPQTFEDCAKFVEDKFLDHRSNKVCYSHRTCATDTKSIEFVFKACIDIITAANMANAGML